MAPAGPGGGSTASLPGEVLAVIDSGESRVIYIARALWRPCDRSTRAEQVFAEWKKSGCWSWGSEDIG